MTGSRSAGARPHYRFVQAPERCGHAARFHFDREMELPRYHKVRGGFAMLWSGLSSAGNALRDSAIYVRAR